MKIAICQTNPVIGDFEHNTALMLDALRRAEDLGCLLAIFPEMALSGYPPKDLLEKSAFIEENRVQLEKLASHTTRISVLCGYVARNPVRVGKPLINSAAFLDGGSVAATGGKRLLPSYDVFDETRYFEPAPESLIFAMEGIRCGVTICEDIWAENAALGVPHYTVDPVGDLTRVGIDCLINISASPYSINKIELRYEMLRHLSRKYGFSTVYCNQVGGNDDLLFDGASMVVDPEGRLIRMAGEFEPDLIVWDTESLYTEIKDPWPHEVESIRKGLVMGTRDYILKCGFKKALVGLSGGIDSALVACIAVQALGSENVTGVSMPSPYTSDRSRTDARELAGNLGIRFEEIPIQPIMAGYEETLAHLFKGTAPDETEENIQARIRGNILMAISNKFGALLLATGNKSELAVGYCTLYGDMAGALAVIGDVPKTTCYRLAHHINKDKIRIPESILSRPPSAELKPDQLDQDTLPPYDLLDEILKAAIEEKLGFEEIVARGHDPSLVEDILRRLVVNEYKRAQAPPVLKMSSRAFGYGRRYPIARARRLF
ncbi:MAG: NAD+ synthase [Deltaproteobacteria bacterium]|nr:NAD+ synthase [Deltaproteobacteria bacterium]